MYLSADSVVSTAPRRSPADRGQIGYCETFKQAMETVENEGVKTHARRKQRVDKKTKRK